MDKEIVQRQLSDIQL